MAAAAFGGWSFRRGQGRADAQKLFEQPMSVPAEPLKTYHLGHSLVGRDMPAMLAQLAGHEYHSQLGWGTSLMQHWEPHHEIYGFVEENAHSAYRPAKEALRSGGYDAVIFTEMVELRAAIKSHDAASYLAKWANLAQAANPEARLYLYETWHHTDDKAGWLNRLDADFEELWLGQVLYPALAKIQAPIYVIPAGQVMAKFVQRVQATGRGPEVEDKDHLFRRNDDGTQDTIHFNDLGAYLVALTHFAVLYHRSPVGLPHQLIRADGDPALAPSAETALLMQQVVWDVVRQHPQTGVTA